MSTAIINARHELTGALQSVFDPGLADMGVPVVRPDLVPLTERVDDPFGNGVVAFRIYDSAQRTAVFVDEMLTLFSGIVVEQARYTHTLIAARGYTDTETGLVSQYFLKRFQLSTHNGVYSPLGYSLDQLVSVADDGSRNPPGLDSVRGLEQAWLSEGSKSGRQAVELASLMTTAIRGIGSRRQQFRATGKRCLRFVGGGLGKTLDQKMRSETGN